MELGGNREELGDERRTGLDNLLEVVEHQQQRAMLDEVPHALLKVAVVLLADPERNGGGCSHGWAIPGVLEGHEVRPVGEVGQEVVRGRERKPGLAGSARSRECYEPSFADEVDDSSELGGSADQRCRRQGQIVGPGIERSNLWEIVG
jgi:hypothetical protein